MSIGLTCVGTLMSERFVAECEGVDSEVELKLLKGLLQTGHTEDIELEDAKL